MKKKKVSGGLWLFAFLFTITAAVATATQEEQVTAEAEEARIFVDETILKNMQDLVIINKRWVWNPTKALLEIYREIGSCPNAAREINKMLIKRNESGANAIIQLTIEELVNPNKSPITSTKQVKRVFFRAIQKAEGWKTKEQILNTFRDIFSLEGMTPVEKKTVLLLAEAIDREMTITTDSIVIILLLLIEEIGEISPLDREPKSLLKNSGGQ